MTSIPRTLPTFFVAPLRSRSSRDRVARSVGLLSSIALLFALAPNVRGGDEDRVFRAGAFAADITPALPISLNGQMSDRTAQRIADPLFARCLVLDNGGVRLAIVVCDSCMISRDLFDSAKRRAAQTVGIPMQQVLASATHTHSAPTATGVFQSEPDDDYCDLLEQRIAEGLRVAVGRLEPARVGWAVGVDDRDVFNRRWRMKAPAIAPDPFGRSRDQVVMNPPSGSADLIEPAGPIDPGLPIIAVQSTQGRPIALLANYCLHYVGGTPPDAVSADYFGAFADRVKQLMGGDDSFVGIMSNGTSGDLNNTNFKSPPSNEPPFERIRLVADRVAREAHRAAQRIQYRDWVPLAARERSIELATRLPTSQEIQQAKEVLQKANGRSLRTVSEIYARETVLLAEFPESTTLLLQALRIGDVGIAAIPCEVFCAIGLSIKRQSPLQPSFVIELANGYNGYLPTEEHHRLGGYETWRARSSYLETGAAAKVEKTLLELLKEVSRGKEQG